MGGEGRKKTSEKKEIYMERKRTVCTPINGGKEYHADYSTSMS